MDPQQYSGKPVDLKFPGFLPQDFVPAGEKNGNNVKSFAKSFYAQFITVEGPLGLSQQGIEKYHLGTQA